KGRVITSFGISITSRTSIMFVLIFPPAVLQTIKDRADMRGPQIWKEILKTYPEPLFSYHQVYNHLLKLNSGSWRLDEDEEKSARFLIEKLCAERPDSAVLEHIELPDDPDDGYTAFAFGLPSLIKKWGGCVLELQLDSTFKTNKVGMNALPFSEKFSDLAFR
ncbi:unnamed protein product, partial [Mycena citricolor]